MNDQPVFPAGIDPADLLPQAPEPEFQTLLAAILGPTTLEGARIIDGERPGWVNQLGERMRIAIIGEGDGDGPFPLGLILGRLCRWATLYASTKHELAALAARLKALFPPILSEALSTPPEECAEFFRGFGTAMTMPADRVALPSQESSRFLLYMALLAVWPKVERFPRSSDLHEFLVSKMGRGAVGDLSEFQRLCRRIGLFRGRVGRPKRTRTHPKVSRS